MSVFPRHLFTYILLSFIRQFISTCFRSDFLESNDNSQNPNTIIVPIVSPFFFFKCVIIAPESKRISLYYIAFLLVLSKTNLFVKKVCKLCELARKHRTLSKVCRSRPEVALRKKKSANNPNRQSNVSSQCMVPPRVM